MLKNNDKYIAVYFKKKVLEFVSSIGKIILLTNFFNENLADFTKKKGFSTSFTNVTIFKSPLQAFR